MIDSGRYKLSNGRTVYYDNHTPRQVALLVEDNGIRYGRCLPINDHAELYGATRCDYVVGDVIQLTVPTVPYYKQGSYVIAGVNAPFTVSVIKLTQRRFVPTVSEMFAFDVRWFVGMVQRPFLPYPHVPICPVCREQGRGEAALQLKRLERNADPVYFCDLCWFRQAVELD